MLQSKLSLSVPAMEGIYSTRGILFWGCTFGEVIYSHARWSYLRQFRSLFLCTLSVECYYLFVFVDCSHTCLCFLFQGCSNRRVEGTAAGDAWHQWTIDPCQQGPQGLLPGHHLPTPRVLSQGHHPRPQCECGASVWSHFADVSISLFVSTSSCLFLFTYVLLSLCVAVLTHVHPTDVVIDILMSVSAVLWHPHVCADRPSHYWCPHVCLCQQMYWQPYICVFVGRCINVPV